MRLTVEVRDEYEDRLRRLAFKNHRAVREQAGYMLECQLEELAALEADTDPTAESVVSA